MHPQPLRKALNLLQAWGPPLHQHTKHSVHRHTANLCMYASHLLLCMHSTTTTTTTTTTTSNTSRQSMYKQRRCRVNHTWPAEALPPTMHITELSWHMAAHQGQGQWCAEPR
jgi:hypothetical protein